MKIFKLKNYSFTTKILLTFFISILIFMLIRFMLIVPKIEEESLNQEIEYIQRFLLITKEQIKIMRLIFDKQTDFEIKLSKLKIEDEVKKIDLNSKNFNQTINLIKTNEFINNCSYRLTDKKKSMYNLKKEKKTNEEINLFDKNNINDLNQWIGYQLENNSKKFTSKNYFFYNFKLNSINSILSLQCSLNNLNPNHASFEKNFKENLRTNLLIDSSLKNTKIALFWVNPTIDTNSNHVLYEKDLNKTKNIYTVAKVSNIDNIPTGNLTIKEIFEAKDTSPIEHAIDNEKVYTWIIDLSNNKNYFILAYTVNKEELENKNKNKILFLLPEVIAIGISLFIMLFLFRRILKNINTLTKTASKVNQGDKNIRSNVKGEDDIGILGQSFDSMLNFFENNIKILDKKVEDKTKEISKSLEEKEILLKEIHHRVKNNLALTISLIELQEEEIQDKKAKKVLLNIQERLYTMELLHRKLYESTNLNKISLKSYITDLVQTIAKTYIKENEIDIKINIEDVNLNIETAMPYGLILNELLTNAFKYAFKNQKNPSLIIDISKSEDEKISFIVKDNGEGLKKEFSKISNETLGLRLISMIVKYQLMGEIFYEYENGAKFIIEGKINN